MKSIKIINRALTIMAIFALVFVTYVNTASAGVLNTQWMHMSSSTPAAGSTTYTIHFRPSVTTGILQIGLRFCTTDGTYGASCTIPTGLVLPASGSVTLTGFGSTAVSSATGSTYTETIVKTTGTAEVTGTDHQIAIAGITNPNAGVFYVRMITYSDAGSTVIDTGSTASATIAQVTLQGTQRSSLAVTIAGSNGTSICDATTQSTTANDATNVYFNDFNGTTAINSGQSINVGTNATNGYTAYAYANHGLLSGSTYINDAPQIADGSQGTVSTTWSAYTGLGVCASSGDANTTMYGSGTYYYHAIANGAASVTKTLASRGTPTASSTTLVNYKVNVSASLTAGLYTNSVNYLVEPNF